MIKHSVRVVFVLLSVCLSLNAQQAPASVARGFSLDREDIFNRVDGSALLHSLSVPPPAITALDLVPLAYLAATETATVKAAAQYRTITPAPLAESRVDPVYAGGEIGILYGRSSGKYRGDEFQSYIFGTVGNEHFQISAGAAYEESSTRFRRFSR